MKRIISTIIVLVISLLVGTYVFASSGIVQTNSLNVRESASTESNSIGVLEKNQTVNIISKENDWYKIQLDTKEGYVKGDYIEVEEESETKKSEEKQIDSSSEKSTENDAASTSLTGNNKKIERKVEVYILPLVNSTKIGILEEGTEISIISNNGRWLYVQSEKTKGWIISNKVDTIDSVADEKKDNKIESNATIEENTTTDEKTTNEVAENKVEESKTTETDSGNYPVTMYVAGDSINIRKSASTTADVISGASKNSAIKVIAKEGDWYKVDTEDGVGYIKSDLLTSTKN